MLIHTYGLRSSAQPCHSTAESQGSRDDLGHPHSVQTSRQHPLHSSLQLQTRINHTREILDCGCWIIWVLSDSSSVDLFHQSSTSSSSRGCGQSRPACGTSHWCHNPRRRGHTCRLGQNPTFPQCSLWKPVKHTSALAVLGEDLVSVALGCETNELKGSTYDVGHTKPAFFCSCNWSPAVKTSQFCCLMCSFTSSLGRLIR